MRTYIGVGVNRTCYIHVRVYDVTSCRWVQVGANHKGVIEVKVTHCCTLRFGARMDACDCVTTAPPSCTVTGRYGVLQRERGGGGAISAFISDALRAARTEAGCGRALGTDLQWDGLRGAASMRRRRSPATLCLHARMQAPPPGQARPDQAPRVQLRARAAHLRGGSAPAPAPARRSMRGCGAGRRMPGCH